MLKAIIKTGVLVVLILVLAQFVPLVAQYEPILLLGALAFGLIGVVGRIFIWLLLAAAVVLLAQTFF